MPSLSPDQIEQLRKKGLDDTKIRALAAKKGYSMPSTLSSIGSAITKNVRGFGNSIAGALGNTPLLSDTKAQIDQTNDLNKQVTNNLITAIKDKRSRGEDTTRLMEALKTVDSEVNFYDILNKSTGGSLDKSARQVFGEAAGVATDIAGLGSLPLKAASLTKAGSIGQGILQGAKTGVVAGGSFGTAQGASRAAQDNRTAGEIVGAGIRGGIEGGLTGAAIGGVVGGVSGGIAGRGQKVARSKEDFVLDLVSENPTKKVRELAVSQGRATEPGIFRSSKILPSSKDYRLADAVDDVVSPKNSPLQNIDSIRSRVDDINSGVEKLITQKKSPFNENQLRSRLNAAKADNNLIFASDATAERVYNAVVDEFVAHVRKKDTLGLFKARQAFDKIPAIKKLLDSEGLGENVKKQIVLDVRRAANDYISSLLPANNPYRALLRQESLMIEAIGNISEKSAGVIGKNKLQLLTQNYPILKWLIGGAATGAVGAAGVGVGSAIIGSTN